MDNIYQELLRRLVSDAPSIVLLVLLLGYNVKRYVINGIRQRWIDYHDEMLSIMRTMLEEVMAWRDR